MRKLLKVFLVFVLVVLFSTFALAEDMVTTKVVTTQVSKKEISAPPMNDRVNKSMSVTNPNLELSASCRVIGDTAYWTITGIYTYSATNFWKDVQVLKNMGINKIIAYINSGGGSVFAGMDLADQIRIAKEEGFYIEMHARGIIASAAVPVFLAGSERISSHNTMFMLHRTTTFKMFASENLEDLEQQREMLQKMRNRYTQLVVQGSTLTPDRVLDMLKKTSWFFAEQAKEYGMVDKLE